MGSYTVSTQEEFIIEKRLGTDEARCYLRVRKKSSTENITNYWYIAKLVFNIKKEDYTEAQLLRKVKSFRNLAKDPRVWLIINIV